MSDPVFRCSKRCLTVLLALLATTALGQSRVATEADLAEVRSRIETLTERVATQTRERDALTAQLATVEQELADVQSRRRSLRAEQAAASERLVIAEERVTQQTEALGREQVVLANQLRSAYTSGRQERLKLFLSQQSPAEVGRMLVYYRYLNDARLGVIDRLNERLAELERLVAAVQAEQARLSELAEESEQLIASLRERRAKRQVLLTDIERQLTEQSARLGALAEQEAQLKSLIEELSSILSDYPVNAEQPIVSLKGELTWPVAGQLIQNFGQTRTGANLRSKGIVLATDAGTEVRSIYHGRVAYADWLPGMGLLIIVDHGDDLMSLYGYNETLTKTVGDWISPGEIIATVGNTGGQASAGLYFELRQGARAVNPRPWFKNRPGADRR